jgi:hypothetical protein
VEGFYPCAWGGPCGVCQVNEQIVCHGSSGADTHWGRAPVGRARSLRCAEELERLRTTSAAAGARVVHAAGTLELRHTASRFETGSVRTSACAGWRLCAEAGPVQPRALWHKRPVIRVFCIFPTRHIPVIGCQGSLAPESRVVYSHVTDNSAVAQYGKMVEGFNQVAVVFHRMTVLCLWQIV